ncbi:MAG: acyltransferase [Bacteroides sp.]|nr:acyltransferase [Bacteroides sp.]
MIKDTTKTRICSIDIFKYACAIMVVAIHAHPFSDVNKELGYIFTEIIPRIAVPFFFAVSGYFYIPKLENDKNPFFPYFTRLLSTYFIWSIFYYFVAFIRNGHLDLKDFLIKSIYQFIVTGSHYHFWFFPALIFAVCFTTLLFKFKCNKLCIPLSIFLYIIGCLGCSYYEIGTKIPILQNLFLSSHFNLIRRVLLMGVPFFISGYLVYKIKIRYVAINKMLGGNTGSCNLVSRDYHCPHIRMGE